MKTRRLAAWWFWVITALCGVGVAGVVATVMAEDGTPQTPLSPFDSDGDGDIDLRDFAVFQNTFDLDNFAVFLDGFTGPR